MLPAGSHPSASSRYLTGGKSFFANFDSGFIAYSFLSSGPNDEFNLEDFKNELKAIAPIVNEEFRLIYSQLIIEKVILYTEGDLDFINSGCKGQALPLAFFPASDWNMSIHTKHKMEPFGIINESDLEMDKSISSSTLLRDGSRVLVTRFGVLTNPNNNAARFAYDDVEPFVDRALELLEKEKTEFDKKWMPK